MRETLRERERERNKGTWLSAFLAKNALTVKRSKLQACRVRRYSRLRIGKKMMAL